MKILSLTAENVKRLVAVEIKPDGNVVQITGKNASGKTSILDSIYWALCGAGAIQSDPIRSGQEEARITLDLGEIVVTRTFRQGEDDNTFTTKIEVYSAEGARYPSPQAMLDKLIGTLSFDPLEFARKPPKDQFDALKRFVPGVDFQAIEEANKNDYEKRRDFSRMAKEAAAAAHKIELPAGNIPKYIHEVDIVERLKDAARFNDGIRGRKLRREEMAKGISLLEASIEKHRRQIVDEEQAIKEMRAKLDAAPALPKEADVDALCKELEAAKTSNALAGAFEAREGLRKEATAHQLEAETLTKKMKDRTHHVQEAIAAAKMPVEGIGFGEDVVLLNGIPFSQASHAEQLRASVAIAMAANPKLQVILVRDASILDDESMQIMFEMALNSNYQIWVERVDGSGKVGFVIEDGQLKKGEDYVGEEKLHDDSGGVGVSGSDVQPAPSDAPKRKRKRRGDAAAEHPAVPEKSEPVLANDWDGEGL